jgi:hypothetical protein
MDIEKIIKELNQKDIFQSEVIEYKQLSGGTVSQLYLLKNRDSSQYVVKMNQPQVIKWETHFLETYKSLKLLPKLHFVEASNQYIVYSFINGSTNYARKNKKEMLQVLVEGLINHYQIVPSGRGWGWADEVTDSWERFLVNRVLEANQILEHTCQEMIFNGY